MTEQEVRELDTWIAEYGFGLEYDAELRSWCGRNEEGERFLIQSIAFMSGEFPRVKREIEQRGWRWGGESHPEGWYWFRIWKEQTTEDPPQIKVTMLGEGYERSEELAGCLAFKAAVEATDGET